MEGELQRRLGANLRRHRHSIGLSQEQLGEIWGYSPRYISRLEIGKCNVTLQTLEHLAVLAAEADPLALLAGLSAEPAGKLPKDNSSSTQADIKKGIHPFS